MRLVGFLFLYGILGLTLVGRLMGEDFKREGIVFTPIEHASFVIRTETKTILVDPVGTKEEYEGFPTPTLILITHAHGDHLNSGLIAQLKKENTPVVGPGIVVEKLQTGVLLENGQSKEFEGIGVAAVPAYNLSQDRLKFHPSGVGNGYVITLEGKRIYVSGDTEDIPEMRNLKDLDFAFVCMNLPYTMTVDQAASAVLQMKPRIVFPYHFRGPDGMSDLERFKSMVAVDPEIQTVVLNWY